MKAVLFGSGVVFALCTSMFCPVDASAHGLHGGASMFAPAGEAVPHEVQPPGLRSDVSRAAVEAQTRAARQDGQLQPAGPATGGRQQRAEEARPSTVDRSTVRAETRAAVRDGTIAPAGQGVPGAS